MSQQAQIGILFALVFVAACWVLAVGHQLDWGLLNYADRSEVLQGFIALSYVVAGLSICVVVTALVASLKK